MMRASVFILCFLAIGVPVVPLSRATVTAAAPAADLTPQQYEDARRLLGRLRTADPLDAATAELVSQVLDTGEYGATQLAVQFSRDIKSRQQRYLKAFEAAASGMVKARWPSDIEQQVEAQRAIVLGVARGPGLTKAKITEQSDPAMHKLEELLVVDRNTVLASDDDLAHARRALLQQFAFWKQADAKVPTAKRDTIARVADADGFTEALEAREAFLTMLATPMHQRDRQVMLANFTIARDMDPQEAVGIHKLNNMRIRLGIGALAIDSKLCDASRDHSKDMKEQNFFAHDSPIAGKTTPWDRARNFGTSASGENIYMGSTQGTAAITAWWYSPGHHTNMLGNHRRVGLGRHAGHWTQMFGR